MFRFDPIFFHIFFHDNLSKAGWSWGGVSAIDSNGRTILIADGHRSHEKRFVARANGKIGRVY
jgi:hypothetical protein